MQKEGAMSVSNAAPSFLLGGGEMGARMREQDWSATPLGSPERWPQSLKTAVRIMLTSRQAMFVWWGEELINLYNDAYKAIVGGKHPEALGQPASRVWREIWDQVGPRAASVIRQNEGTYDESLLLVMERNGYPEETYYTFSYSPVPDDEGGTGGILCANTDNTQSIIGERQLALLRELASLTADARTFDQACTSSARSLETDPYDLPFALIYLIDPEKRRVFLACACGIDRDHPAVPADADIDGDSVWPFAEVIRTHKACVVSDLVASFGDLPAGAWQRPPYQAVAVPIAPSGQTGKAGVLIAGLNPFRLFDDNYRGFIDLVAAQIAASIANAQAYEEERKRAEALAEVDRAKTAFFSNVSHEFRTPLTLMLGPLDDILFHPREELGRENRELLSLVRRNGQRLLKLVNTLLDFSRIEAGRVQAVYEPLDLAAYTAELASVFRAAVEKAGLRLVIDCPLLPEPVFADRDMWEKIVLNLVSNAFKYTLRGEIRVSLRAALEAGNHSAVLSVEDTGTGIPKAELPNIFNRFHRVQETRGRTHEGTGIGLALVLELVKLHGGTVKVDSVYGAGSTFTVAVPFGREHLPADRVGAPRMLESTAVGVSPFVEEALRWLPGTASRDTGAFPIQTGLLQAGRSAAAGSRPTVVLADDNADMRDYVRRLLSTDYRVIAVADGAEALRVTTARKPDLVITDVMMPGLDGFGLLKALREDPGTAPIPVVMLSARAGEEARVEGLQAGADDYLTKPFSARELLARVGGTLALAKARREATRREEELKAETTSVLESIAEAFLALDPDFRFTYVNAEAERINGMSREEILGKTFWEVFPATLGTGIETELRRAMAERIPVNLENFYQPWERWFEVDIYPTKTEGVAVYYRDITDRKLAMDALQEADRRKDEFLATLAHELRNPLAPIRNGLQVLRLAHGNPRAEEKARGLIERQVQQMVRLIDDLLDLSRISRGKVELRRERIDLAAAVQSAVETSRPLIEQAGHELTLSLPSEPVFVDADVTRLAQVFANLLNNAAKYTEGGGDIRLSVEPHEKDVLVRVRDNGVGIPASMLPRIFEMFTQVDRSLERTQGGLGIGLSIVKRLVEMHGGTVEAHSEGRGRGSELVVRLPVLAPSVQEPRPRGDGQEPAGVPARRRILVADDNVDSAESLGMMLEFMGNEVRTAHDGVEAVETAAAFRPDVILLDIGMPRMNGYDACRRIREQPWGSSVAIVALTGWGQDEDKRRSREAGFDHHLVKPVEPAALETLLAAVQARPA
jgi:PAS domain S-box-containing protein